MSTGKSSTPVACTKSLWSVCSIDFYQENKEIIELLTDLFNFVYEDEAFFDKLSFFILDHKEYEECIIISLCYLSMIRPKKRDFIFKKLILPRFNRNPLNTCEIISKLQDTHTYCLFSVLGYIKFEIDSLPQNLISLPTKQEQIQFLFHPYKANSIESILEEDKIDDLQQLACLLSFDYNQIVTYESFSSFVLGQDQTTIINFAIFYGSYKCFAFLLLNGACLNNNSLMFAICSGNLEIYKTLQNKGVQYFDCINACIKYHQYDLFESIVSGHYEIINEFNYELPLVSQNILVFLYYSLVDPNFASHIQVKYSITIRNRNYLAAKYLFQKFPSYKEVYNTPLALFAVQNNFLSFLSFLIEDHNFDPNIQDKDGNSLLHSAIMEDNIILVRYLTETCHADIEIPDKKGNHPLHIACKYAKINIVKYLIENCHADPEAKNSDQMTPLYIACQYNLDIVKYLIEDIHVSTEPINTTKETLLHIACKANKLDVIKYLLEQKFDIEAKDKDGETPLFKCTENRDLLKFLVKTAHANIDAKDNNGRTIFLLACKNSLNLLLAPLYDLKADVHAVDNQKRNALHCAAEIKYVWGYLLDFLIEKCKIIINDVDENGQTPLIYTCSINPVWCGVNADLFVKYGADINIQDNQNKTAYYYARKCQNRDAIECTRTENKN